MYFFESFILDLITAPIPVDPWSPSKSASIPKRNLAFWVLKWKQNQWHRLDKRAKLRTNSWRYFPCLRPLFWSGWNTSFYHRIYLLSWNQLPVCVHRASSVSHFFPKSSLKTVLFEQTTALRYAHMCMCMCVCVRARVCMHVCMHSCVCDLCVCVCVCVCVHALMCL